jgi:hypothetical protein
VIIGDTLGRLALALALACVQAAAAEGWRRTVGATVALTPGRPIGARAIAESGMVVALAIALVADLVLLARPATDGSLDAIAYVIGPSFLVVVAAQLALRQRQAVTLNLAASSALVALLLLGAAWLAVRSTPGGVGLVVCGVGAVGVAFASRLIAREVLAATLALLLGAAVGVLLGLAYADVGAAAGATVGVVCGLVAALAGSMHRRLTPRGQLDWASAGALVPLLPASLVYLTGRLLLG